ncbi:hypothetical protein TRICI_006587 [Trichomonascus ciferrii]|uniref:Uncharacterized protein n=1 Tax=Trichomonascus ciferrii TaxID=44093 RepID=A0A642UG65_9ASCO|nr:hypothetical protein TRICI_006587 [Trichomonascus ciferrii]
MKGQHIIAIAMMAVYASAVWDLSVNVVSVASLSIAIVCATAGSINCLIVALANCLLAAGSAMKSGTRNGQTTHAKRDLPELVALNEKPSAIANSTVYTLFPDMKWYADAGHHLFNETVMEQVSSLGTTFARKKNGYVYISNIHPDQKLTKREDSEFVDFVVSYKEDSSSIDDLTQDDANNLARDILGSQPPHPQQWCATVTSDKDDSRFDLGITIDSQAWMYTSDEPACAA